MIKIWKNVPGFVGKYQASKCGLIRSCLRITKSPRGKRIVPEKILTRSMDRYGYFYVVLFKKGKRYRFTVHRLIAATFLGKSKLHVNHKDGIKTNNVVENLEYVTAIENFRHGIRFGLIKRKGTDNPRSKLTEENVLYIRNSKNHLELLAKKFNVSISTIHDVIKTRTWKHVS